MRMYDIIVKKRDGATLSDTEIQYFVEAYTNGDVPDYQASALLMAIYLQGMDAAECASLTQAMANSGATMDLSAIAGIKVDKHSTGGVGDTTTLILAPLVASIGVPVAKMSGRGLGHTGGTIDKLESIPGFCPEISNEKFVELVNRNKLAVVGQTKDLAPADKLLYSLRDVTATVESIPLIASSVMSKKIAAGAEAIVLDVKLGSGAFMKDFADAKELAETMVAIGSHMGRKTVAILSDMNQPLGKAIGNALEVKEAIDTLRGEGPEDLTELCLVLGSHMAVLAEKAPNFETAKQMLIESMETGKALNTFKLFLESQDGDSSVVDHPEQLPQAAIQFDLLAPESGYIHHMEAEQIGHAAMMLGAGRETKQSIIDLAAGIMLHKKTGDAVQAGEAILTVYTNKPEMEWIKDKLLEAIRITPAQPEKTPLIYESIQK